MDPTDREPLLEPGSTVAFREVWRDAPWSTWATIVVADGDGRTMLYRPIGMPGMLPTNENGRFGRSETGHWHEPAQWEHNHALMIHEWGEPFSIWCMWDADWRHSCWYVNIELPWTRASGAIETFDHELDIVVAPDGSSWEWKDEDRLAAHVAGGAHTQAEADGFRAVGERVVAERIEPLATPFDEGWESWRPDPSWQAPTMPADWDVRVP